MGQYRVSIYSHLQLGFMVSINREEIIVRVPFATVHIAITKYASGFFVFGWTL